MDLTQDDWSVEFHSGIPVYRQIINHIQGAVASGRLREGDQLPTIRALHLKLDVNPNTVAKAYRDLQALGVIQSHKGSGCFVAPVAEAIRLPQKQKQAKMKELASRYLAEAKSHGIEIHELITHLNKGKSHA